MKLENMTNPSIPFSKNKANRGRMPDGKPNPIDIHVGKRMRMRRQNLELSQEKLAQHLGMTFQQIQKYEKGINRIGASRLFDIACALGVSIFYFFEDMDEQTLKMTPSALKGIKQQHREQDPLYNSKNIELINAFNKISNPQVKDHIYNLILKL